MSLLKQLISEMVENYLEESAEDDLIESIFEELSEETLEAIEEAILNELSPALLKRYVKKATPQEKAAERSANKNRNIIDKAEQDRVKAHRLKNKEYNTHSDKLDKGRSAIQNRADKSAKNSASKLQQAKNDLDTADRKSFNRGQGIWRAKDRLSK